MSSSNTGTPGGGGRSSPTTAAAAGLGRRTSSGSHPIHDTTNNSGESSSTMTDTTEQAQFLVKLAPRIRRLEATTTQRLGAKMQTILTRLREHQLVVFEQQQQQQQQSNGLGGDGTPNVEADSTVSAAAATPTTTTTTTTTAESLENGISSETKQESNSSSNNSSTTEDPYQAFLLLLLGHCMRGLVLLGRCNDVESIFARTAIMPLVRSKVSMGLLDQGGSRGECSGLPRLLHDMLTEIANAYSPVLVLAEAMFATTRMGNNSSNKNGGATAAHCSTGMDVDLLTAGVWVPIATALMTDNAIKMAIFRPGLRLFCKPTTRPSIGSWRPWRGACCSNSSRRIINHKNNKTGPMEPRRITLHQWPCIIDQRYRSNEYSRHKIASTPTPKLPNSPKSGTCPFTTNYGLAIVVRVSTRRLK